ncbi:MAG TPA: SDR family NAD(P)-dependent oxidoreductase [Myxococcota bacterium]|nr:SDR family NAD(P)-dependent oxidoreductase [Myxococcota bacterium]
MKAVLLGATRGMGRAVARALAARGERLFLLGRDPDALARSARDLEVRGARAPVASAHCDLLDPAGFGAAFDAADRALDGFNAAILSAGLFATQDVLESDAQYRRDLLAADFAHSIEWCEATRTRLLSRGGGTLCVFSSVAGDRGRTPQVFYGAAKAGLTTYLEGLDHRYHSEGLRVITVKPGFVHTAMTEGVAAPPFAGRPDDVARRVVRALDLGTPVVYAPAIWQAVMLAVRALPRSVMRRAAF